jgi:hypothetical protein
MQRKSCDIFHIFAAAKNETGVDMKRKIEV